MPIYEYACRACDTTYDVLQNINAEPLSHCQTCEGPVTKLVSRSAFQLKGSGWYVTDYAQESGKSQANASTTREKPRTPPGKQATPDSSSPTKTLEPSKTSSTSSTSAASPST